MPPTDSPLLRSPRSYSPPPLRTPPMIYTPSRRLSPPPTRRHSRNSNNELVRLLRRSGYVVTGVRNGDIRLTARRLAELYSPDIPDSSDIIKLLYDGVEKLIFERKGGNSPDRWHVKNLNSAAPPTTINTTDIWVFIHNYAGEHRGGARKTTRRRKY